MCAAIMYISVYNAFLCPKKFEREKDRLRQIGATVKKLSDVSVCLVLMCVSVCSVCVSLYVAR